MAERDWFERWAFGAIAVLMTCAVVMAVLLVAMFITHWTEIF